MSSKEYVKNFVAQSLGIPSDHADLLIIDETNIRIISSLLSGTKSNTSFQDPIIDSILGNIKEHYGNYCRKNNIPIITKCKWPYNKKFAVTLTHDSDTIEVSESHLLKVKSRFSEDDFNQALNGKKNLYWNVDRLADIEKKYGFNSSFYFLTSEYDLADHKEILNNLNTSGWEIGLHGGFGTHNNNEKMKSDIVNFKHQLGFDSLGIREHYLQFDYHVTWDILEDNNFVYDTSLGFREHPGFMAGISIPFHPPDKNWTTREIIELPLIIMDTSLWGYMNLGEDEGMDIIEKFIDVIKNKEGLLTILWHQEALLMKKGNIYPKILEKLSKENCYVDSGIMIATWWKDRNKSELVLLLDNDGWHCNLKNVPAGLCIEVGNISTKPIIEGSGKIINFTNHSCTIELSGDCVLRYAS